MEIDIENSNNDVDCLCLKKERQFGKDGICILVEDSRERYQ